MEDAFYKFVISGYNPMPADKRFLKRTKNIFIFFGKCYDNYIFNISIKRTRTRE